MKVLITGSQGYIGTPLCYELFDKHDVIGIDNSSRENWVNLCTGSKSSKPFTVHKNIVADLTDYDLVYQLLSIHKPSCIIHLASQPSMPYSQISPERALFTQYNNLAMCLNLLWAIKELKLKCRFVITTTTGIPGQFYKQIPEEPVVNQAGSWYHVSRGFDSANCSLAARQWGIEVLELRTSIVYGLQTDLMKGTGLATRFDTDMYFGTALNRFLDQALNKQPITIYGKGEQIKPFISLEDCVHSLINAIDYKMHIPHMIMNQVTYHLSIVDLAGMIAGAFKTEISHIPNPRVENEAFRMRFDNQSFLELLDREPTDIESDIQSMADFLTNQDLGSAEVCECKTR